MFFWSLLLAHVIGDFPLQTDAIFRLKTKYWWGVLPHVTICSIINSIVLIPYWSEKKVWGAIIILGVIHTVLDRVKISVSEKIARDNFFQFFIDQLLHVVSIWLVAWWLVKVVDYDAFQVSGIFASRDLVVQLTAYIFAAFAGVPIIFYAQKFWQLEVIRSNKPVLYPNFLQRVPGYFERFLATLGIVWAGWWLVLAVGAFLPRLVLKWKDDDRSLIGVTALVGLLISILCGVAVHIILAPN